MAKITIAELDLDVNSLIKSTADVKKVIDQLKEAQKELTKQGETSSEQFVQNASDLKVLNSAYSSNLKAIADSTNAKAEETNRTELLNIALQAEATSIKEAREQNALLNKLRNETNVTTEEGKRELDELNKKLDQNNDFIKENADAYLQQKINIGNYSDSIKDALSNLNPLNGGLTGFIARSREAGGVLPLLSNGLKAVTTGIYGMVKASLTFLATPIGAVIGAIGLVLGGLITYLKSTQEGMDKITAVTRPLIAIFQSLIGVAQNVGKFLFEAFSNPKKTLEELADFVKTNLINRFTAFGKILEGIINLDFKAVTDGVLQAGTGVENLTDKIADGAKETAKFLDEAAKKGAEIDKLQKEIEKGQIAFEKNTISINNLLDEQELIAKDTSLSFEERAKASTEIIRLTQELGNEEALIIEKKIKQLEIQQSLNDTSREGQLELIELRKQLDDAQDRGVEAEKEQLRVLAGLRKEQEAEAKQRAKEAEDRRQKALDDAVKLTKAEIDLFLSSQGIKAKSLEDNLKLAEDINKKQIELAQKEFEASKKTQADKLALQTAINNANNQLLQSQQDAIVSNAENELKNFIELNKSKLDSTKFLNDEIVQAEKDRNAQILQEQLDFEKLKLEQGVTTQQQYNEAINAINLDNEAKLEALRIEKEKADEEKRLIDLENKRLTGEENFKNEFELRQQQIEQQREQEIKASEKTGASIELINKKFNAQLVALDKAKEIAKIQNVQNALNTVSGLLSSFFGDSKALNTALALADTFLSVQKAYLSQFLPIPTPDSPVRGQIAGLKALGFGLANVAKIQGLKFEQGGVMQIGGNRHSSGGTKFVGSDGTRFEAERGELIGVMNRKASSKFMSFNDAFGSKGQVGTTYAQTGGIIARGMNSGEQDLEQLANLTAQAVSMVPTPVVTVEDINRVATRVNVIENGANF